MSSESMSWWNGAWRLTRELYVHDGTAWKPVTECWIWFDSAWRRCFVESASLDSVTATNPFGDIVNVAWTFTSSNPTAWLMTIEASINSGATFVTMVENVFAANDVDNNPYLLDFSGISGFTTLDETAVRVSMRFNGVTHAQSSPRTVFPPYAT
jgi:hypothetical protein